MARRQRKSLGVEVWLDADAAEHIKVGTATVELGCSGERW
jgi:hypothetical protein